MKFSSLKLTSMFKKPENKVYKIAESYIGTHEIPGEDDNPKIVEFFAKVGHSWVKDDETAWCAAFVGACLEEAGYKSTKKLNARSYLEWGDAVMPNQAEKGDVIIFWRESPQSWKGHVAFFHSYDANGNLNVLGGNQSNAVTIETYKKGRLLGVRRPI
jgi:uncharacterized protein (TIGR02594 family)